MKKAEKLINIARKKQIKIACAESCTGGLLGAKISAVPGASDVFLGGIISYDNRLKSGLLGVDSQVLQKYGAVSRQSAEQMAMGAIKATKADLAVSITGIAGPSGGSKTRPVGTVWIGIAKKGKKARARLYKFEDAGRGKIRKKAVKSALELLLEAAGRN